MGLGRANYGRIANRVLARISLNNNRIASALRSAFWQSPKEQTGNFGMIQEVGIGTAKILVAARPCRVVR